MSFIVGAPRPAGVVTAKRAYDCNAHAIKNGRREYRGMYIKGGGVEH